MAVIVTLRFKGCSTGTEEAICQIVDTQEEAEALAAQYHVGDIIPAELLQAMKEA